MTPAALARLRFPSDGARWSAVIPTRPKAKHDGPNARKHWAARHRRGNYWGIMVVTSLTEARFPRSLPDNGRGFVVTFCVGQRRGPLMDSDNAQGCLKQARDYVAEYLGVSDGPNGPTWRYDALRASEDYTEIVLEQEPPAPGGAGRE